MHLPIKSSLGDIISCRAAFHYTFRLYGDKKLHLYLPKSTSTLHINTSPILPSLKMGTRKYHLLDARLPYVTALSSANPLLKQSPPPIPESIDNNQ